MPRFLIHSHQQQLEIVQQIQHPNLFAQVDIYHLATSVGLDRLRESLLEILPITRHIQFADWPGRGEPGTGSIDFTTALSEIHASGFNGFVAAEYKPTRDTPMTLEWLPTFRKLLNAN
jgi:hydroxypyruvate isomerase